MFNFTTQTVYNYISSEGANRNLWVSENGQKPSVRIGNTRFDQEDILDILVKMPTVENLASVTFDMSSLAGSNERIKTARIVLYVGLSMNSQDALYANDFVYKGKPLYVEFPFNNKEQATTIAARVASIAKKYFLFTMQEKILDVINNGNGTVTFLGVNGYQQIKKAVLLVFDPEAKTVDCCSNQGDYLDLIVGVPVIYTTSAKGEVTTTKKVFDGVTEGGRALADNEVAIEPGLEAFGDYNWIIHNLRLPTLANTNFWSPTNHAGEMPVPGAQYVQVIIRMCKERDGIVGEIVGARAKSVTTHVLYVEVGAYNASLASVLGTLSQNLLTDADTVLQDPFGVSSESSSSN